jgi:hypothetical protein
MFMAWDDSGGAARVCDLEHRGIQPCGPQPGLALVRFCGLAKLTRDPPRLVLGAAWLLILSAYPARFCYYYSRKRRPIWEEGNGMAQAENIDSGIPNFQLDNRSGRDHRSLAHLSKFTLSGAGARLLAPIPHGGAQARA